MSVSKANASAAGTFQPAFSVATGKCPLPPPCAAASRSAAPDGSFASTSRRSSGSPDGRTGASYEVAAGVMGQKTSVIGRLGPFRASRRPSGSRVEVVGLVVVERKAGSGRRAGPRRPVVIGPGTSAARWTPRATNPVRGCGPLFVFCTDPVQSAAAAPTLQVDAHATGDAPCHDDDGFPSARRPPGPCRTG
jgi:hypothetical protein